MLPCVNACSILLLRPKTNRDILDLVKKKKVVITGGLGYIGVELCKLYSGEAWYTNIVVNDSRFCSERVSQLRDWGMSFVQADIMDQAAMSEILGDADVVIHLAWNFFDVIKEQNAWLADQGTRFISIKDLQKESFK